MSAPQSPNAPGPSSRPEAGRGPAQTFDARRIHTRIGTGGIGKDVMTDEKAVAILFVCDTTDQATELWRAVENMWRTGLFKIECKPHPGPRSTGPEDGRAQDMRSSSEAVAHQKTQQEASHG